jgi:hypothetical protein
METKKVFISTQLLAVLPPVVLKFAAFIVNWQNSPNGIMLYEHRFAKTLKLTEQEVRLSIQTLINLKLISLTNIDNKFKIEFNHDEWQKYYKISMDKVIEHQGYKMATEVTYDKESNHKQASNNDIEDMSEQDLKRLLLRIEASLSEKQQMKKTVVSVTSSKNDDVDGLPF